MPGEVSLIAGLGNPGTEYADTRHNAGFRFIDAMLAEFGGSLRPEGRFSGRAARIAIGGREIWLLEPDTFMNHSGEAVARLARYYKILTEEILVVHDEMDLPPGTVRLKRGGSSGGHNGVADIAEKLGGGEFLRLRIGIGRPANSAQVISYVLRRVPVAEQELIDAAIHDALGHVEDIVHGHSQKAMNALHTHTR
ncbi:MAG: aminoacyl-tRNA hydrolase [Acidiferrobacterales bacterium]